jgi:hypothetical protein
LPLTREFNTRFDKAGFKFLREFRRHINDDGGRTWAISQRQLILFFLAIFWRAALSSNEKYRGIVLSEANADQIKRILKSRNNLTLRGLSVRVRNVIDGYGYIEPNEIPGDANVFWPVPLPKDEVWFALMMNNFYIELEMPGKRTKRKGQGFLSLDKNGIEIVDVDLHEEPVIYDTFKSMTMQHIDGEVPDGFYQWSMKYHQRRKKPLLMQSEIDTLAEELVAAEKDPRGSPRDVLKRMFPNW